MIGLRSKMLVAVLVVTVALGAIPGAAMAKQAHGASGRVNAQVFLDFSDWEEARWALEHMLSMRLLGIINGYGDGTFRPNQPVTQAEAVVMLVRAMDLEDEVEKYEETDWPPFVFRNRRPMIPPGQMKKIEREQAAKIGTEILHQLLVAPAFRWAEGYVKLAVDKGWIDPDEIEPSKPASRAWVARLLVRAMGMEDEAEALSDEDLDFKDAKSIPDEFVGYVAVAVNEGIFTGDDKGLFRPNDPVTRAEMAALIDRTLDIIDDTDEEDETDDGDVETPIDKRYKVNGKVTAIGTSTITVEVRKDVKKRYDVSEDALVFVDGEEAELDDIEPGYTVKMILNGDGVAILISSKPTENRETEKAVISGTIQRLVITRNDPDQNSITIEDRRGDEYTFGISEDVDIYSAVYADDEDDDEDEGDRDDEDENVLKLSDLEAGDKVIVKVENQVVYEIILRERQISS